jgi:uncharacterized membrane protein
MAYCTKCGTQVADGVEFCGKCGQPMNAPLASPAVSVPGDTGMAENIAGLLCYVLGWLTGLIFFFIDKRPFVRFHAAQSIVVFGGLQIIQMVLARVFVASLWVGGFGALSLGWVLLTGVELLALALWILLMVKAYQHDKFAVPVVSGIVENLARK